MTHSPATGQPDVAQYRLDTLQRVIAAQNELVNRLSTLKRATTSKLVLKSLLLDIVQIANRLTAAEESSIFILNPQGVVVESLLARGAVLRDLKNNLIGQVLDHGLAGWVLKHQRLGLVDDTETDPRWTNLASQPYEARSALCIPLMKGRQVLGILTLMHSQPRHFHTIAAKSFTDVMPTSLALLLENAQLHDQQLLSGNGDHHHPIADGAALPQSLTPPATGIYILRANGQLQYASPHITEIFGYSLAELVAVESIIELFHPDNQPQITSAFQRCFDGLDRTFALHCRGYNARRDELTLYLEGNVTKLYGASVIVGALRLLDD